MTISAPVTNLASSDAGQACNRGQVDDRTPLGDAHERDHLMRVRTRRWLSQRTAIGRLAEVPDWFQPLSVTTRQLTPRPCIWSQIRSALLGVNAPKRTR
jgi:hypothetical protein